MSFERPEGRNGKERMNTAKYMVEALRHLKKERPLLVAFDGVDASGKTSLADSVARELEKESGMNPVRISIDRFHNSREVRMRRGELSPEGYFYDSFDYTQIMEKVVAPVKKGAGRITGGIYDFRADMKIAPNCVEIGVASVVLFDGIFMNRDELHAYWDLSVYLDVEFETVLQRAKKRDVDLFGSIDAVMSKYLNRYIPGQKLYQALCNPKERADIVIDNNDYENPVLVKEFRA